MKTNKVTTNAFMLGVSSFFLFGASSHLLNNHQYLPETEDSIADKAWRMTAHTLNKSFSEEKNRLENK